MSDEKHPFPYVVLDSGKILSASLGKQYSMMHIEFLSSNPDEIFEAFKKLGKVCEESFPTKVCPKCNGKMTTPKDTERGRNCSGCNGHGKVPDGKNMDNPNAAYFAGLAFGWASRLGEEDVRVEDVIEDMKKEAERIAKYAGVDPLE